MSALACFVLLCFRNKSHESDLLGLYLREGFFSFFQLHESPILCLFSKTTHRRTLCCTRRLKKQLIGYQTQQSVNCFIYALIKIRCCYSSTKEENIKPKTATCFGFNASHIHSHDAQQRDHQLLFDGRTCPWSQCLPAAGL